MEQNCEMKNFIEVWITVVVSLSYCFTISKIIPKGLTRLVTIFPIVCLFLALPLKLTSIHLGGPTSFFISWLGTFKLLLFCFGKGPLSIHPSISILHFVAVGCLPINIQHQTFIKSQIQNKPKKFDQFDLNEEYPSHETTKEGFKSQIENDPFQFEQNKQCPPQKFDQFDQNEGYPSHETTKEGFKSQIENDPFQFEQKKAYPPRNFDQNNQIKGDPIQIDKKTTKKGSKPTLNYSIKVLLLGMLVFVYGYSDYLHPKVIMILYCIHIYFGLEIILAMVAIMAKTILGLEIEPQFDEPYLSTSLQDFWGRRWNIMVTCILRPTVYDPTLHCATKIVGRKWAPLPAVLSTFVVSGLMHELMFFYMGRVRPTGDTTWFFVLHGVCLTAEIAMKKVIDGRYGLHRVVSGLLVVGFVMSTGMVMFVPQMIKFKADERAFGEYAAIGAFAKDIYQSLCNLFHI